MKKTFGILGLVAAGCILIGAIVFCIGMSCIGWDFKKLSKTAKELRFEENAENTLLNVSIDYQNADVVVAASDSDSLSIVYPQLQNAKGKNLTEVTVTETDEKIEIVEHMKWSWGIGWTSAKPTVTVYLPKERAYNLRLLTDNGDIRCETELSASSATLKTDNGKISVADLSCTGDLTVETDNGKISCANASIGGKASFFTDNGSISVRAFNGTGALTAETKNGKIIMEGDIAASAITVKTDNGEIRSSGTITTQNAVLKTANGDVTATFSGKQADYTAQIKTSNGEANIGNFDGGEKRLEVKTSTGDIRIFFTEQYTAVGQS